MTTPRKVSDVIRTMRSLAAEDPTVVQPGQFQAVVEALRSNEGVCAIVGPAASGKSTLLAEC